MPYVRKHGNQVAIVHGERDAAGQVQQRVLFSLYTKAEAEAAIGKRATDPPLSLHGLVESRHEGIRFDWTKLDAGIAALKDELPERWDYPMSGVAPMLRQAVVGLTRALFAADPQSVFSEVKEVRAASVCLETTAAAATDLYGRYYRLGTWTWKDVRAAAKDDPQRTLRAYRFANTETFATPQSWSALQDSLMRHTSHGNPIASPVKVPEAVFIDLYQRGMGLPDPFSPAALLLSLSPEYAAMIASGRKTVELRRRFPNVATGTEMWIYETLPTGAITGRARILDVHRGPPARLWREFGSMTGISRSAFDQYLAGCDEAAAVMVADHRPLSPVPLPLLRKLMPGFVAPQYFRYLDARELSLLTNGPSVPG